MILSVEGSSIVLYIECLGGMLFREKILRWHNLMSFSVHSDITLS